MKKLIRLDFEFPSFNTVFALQLVRVKDGKWGGEVNGKWNGLVAELINHETDLVMTSLKINSGNISINSQIRRKI